MVLGGQLGALKTCKTMGNLMSSKNSWGVLKPNTNSMGKSDGQGQFYGVGARVCKHRLASPDRYPKNACKPAASLLHFLKRNHWFQKRSWHAKVQGIKKCSGLQASACIPGPFSIPGTFACELRLRNHRFRFGKCNGQGTGSKAVSPKARV